MLITALVYVYQIGPLTFVLRPLQDLRTRISVWITRHFPTSDIVLSSLCFGIYVIALSILHFRLYSVIDVCSEPGVFYLDFEMDSSVVVAL